MQWPKRLNETFVEPFQRVTLEMPSAPKGHPQIFLACTEFVEV